LAYNLVYFSFGVLNSSLAINSSGNLKENQVKQHFIKVRGRGNQITES